MTSIDVRASRTPRANGGTRVLRMLAVALSLGLAVMALTAAPVFAASAAANETESGYNEKPPAPEENEAGYKEKPPAPEEKVAPAEEEAAPEEEAVAPEEEAAPAAEEAAPTTSELPFTGLDLRWVVGAGVLMIAVGGLSLTVTRRRERHGTRR